MIGFLWLAVARPACAGFDEGLVAYQRQDNAVAFHEFHPLAEQGHADAHYFLGLVYRRLEGIPQYHTEAAKWFRRAAEQGHVRGQYGIGFSYQNGQGVRRNHAAALKWFRKAAEGGSTKAVLNLGFMYSQLGGVAADHAEAHKWFNIAAIQGNNQGRKYSDEIAKRMTPAAISKAQKLAHEWLAAFKKRKGK
jgi:TPR repeat protein